MVDVNNILILISQINEHKQTQNIMINKHD